MPHETAVNGNGNGKRWYDSTKIIWALFSVVGMLLGFLCMVIYGKTDSNETSINTHNVKIERIMTTMENVNSKQTSMEAKQDKMDDKLNQILLRMPPR